MSKKHEQAMTDLHRLLDTQDFNTIEEVQAFMNQIIGKPIPSFPKEALSPQEQAQDLVYHAHTLPAQESRATIEKALLIDDECIEAYEFLARFERIPQIASVFFEKGIAIGRTRFGGEYLKKHKGMFWGFHETRPFMRCLHSYADCLNAMKRLPEAVAILEEMIALNPGDNQGVRDQLLLFLIELDERKKFERYAKMYEDDGMAYATYTRALFAFLTTGESEESRKALQRAIKSNRFVPKKLLAKKPVTTVPDYYSMGNANEADYYVVQAHRTWKMVPGALEWLQKHSGKKK
ncbi:MAG: tetratricopeptide repeat protein [Flavobacteriales bacterium]